MTDTTAWMQEVEQRREQLPRIPEAVVRHESAGAVNGVPIHPGNCQLVRERHPFQMDAVVIFILPDHPHCVWMLPEGDADYSTCQGLIKAKFSRSLNCGERRSASRVKRGDAGFGKDGFVGALYSR